MASEFFSNASSTFTGYDITGDQINTLRNRLEGNLTSSEAAKHLTAYPEASSNPVELKQRLGGLWTLLNDAAVSLSSAQPEIISILQSIRTLPRVEEPKGEGQEYIDLDDGYIWKELTDWASNWADAFNSHAARFLIEHDTSDQEKIKRKTTWTSACAYTSRLASTGDDALSSYGGGIDRATRAIAEALEVDAGEHEPDSLEAAAQLFLYAGSDLYHRCKKGQTDGMLTGKAGLWQGEDGFSDARWRFWLERWTALAGQQNVSNSARTIAQQALEAMKKVEASEA